MTSRLLLAGVLIVAAVVVASVVRRIRPTSVPTQPSGSVPAQVDRDDLPGRDRPWLVAVFSSAGCRGCADATRAAEAAAGPGTAVAEIELGARPDLHRRYGIDAVPLVVVADRQGVVRASFVGHVTAGELRATVAALGEQGPEAEASSSL